MGAVIFGLIFMILIPILIKFFSNTSKIDNSINNAGNFVSSQITKAKKIAQQNITKSYITGSTWILINSNVNESILYNFKSNDDLYITSNGIVKKCKYEFLVDSDNILITEDEVTELYHAFNMQDDFFFLKRVSTGKIFALANHTKHILNIQNELKLLGEN